MTVPSIPINQRTADPVKVAQANAAVKPIDEKVSAMAAKIQAHNPSKHAISRFCRHIWVWIKEKSIDFWRLIAGIKSPPTQTKIYLRTKSGLLYQSFEIDKDLLEGLKKNPLFPFQKDSLRAENPLAYATYLQLMGEKRRDGNSLLDPAIHSGNVLQVLETAIELKDLSTIDYCSTFLQSLVNKENHDDFLALAIKYDLKGLDVFIKRQSGAPAKEHSRLKKELLAADSKKAFETALREVQSRLDTSGSFTEAAMLLFEVLATQPSHPTTLKDLLKRRNTRIAIAKMAPDFYKSLPQRVYDHSTGHFQTDDRVFSMLEQFALHFPMKAYYALSTISGNSVSLKTKERLLKLSEIIIGEFLARPKLRHAVSKFSPFWERELKRAFKLPIDPSIKIYSQQLFRLFATHFKEEFITFIVPTYSRNKHELQQEIRDILSSEAGSFDQKLSQVFALIGRNRHQSGQYSQADLHFSYTSGLSTGDQARWAMSLDSLGRGEEARAKLDKVTGFSDNQDAETFITACFQCTSTLLKGNDPQKIKPALALFTLALKKLPEAVFEKNFERAYTYLESRRTQISTVTWRLTFFKAVAEDFLKPDADIRFKMLATTLWEKEFDRYFKSDSRYTNQFLSVLGYYSPTLLADLLSQKIIGGSRGETLKILRSEDSIDAKMPKVYLHLANKLYAAKKYRKADQLYNYASANLDAANTARWAISLLRIDQREKAKTKLETLAGKLNNAVVSRALLECADSYYQAYMDVQAKNRLIRFFSGSKSTEYIETALKMYRWSWESPVDADRKLQIFSERIVPYYEKNLKSDALEKELRSLETELGKKQPKISSLCFEKLLNKSVKTKFRNGFWKSLFKKGSSENELAYKDLIALAKQMKTETITRQCYVGIDKIVQATLDSDRATYLLNLGKLMEQKYPEFSIHCHLRAMKMIKESAKQMYFIDFHKSELLGKFALAVKHFYLQTKNSKQAIAYLDQALDHLGDMKTIIGQNAKGTKQTITKKMAYLVNKGDPVWPFCYDVGSSLHFLKGEIMSQHQDVYTHTEQAAAFQWAVNLAPNNMFGSSAMYAIDDQATAGDFPPICRDLAISWGFPIVQKLTL